MELWVLPLAEAGDSYVSIAKVATFMVLLTPWLYACAWVNKDASRTHFSQGLWSALVVGIGALGVLLWLMLPSFAAGLIVYLLSAAAPVTLFIVQRNKRVKPELRVLTGDHLASLFARKHRQATVEVVRKIKLYHSTGQAAMPPAAEDQELCQVYNMVQNFLSSLVAYRASEVNVIPAGDQTAVKFTIDGVTQPRPPAPRADADAVIDYLKGLAGLNVEDRRRPQSGQFGLDSGSGGVQDIKITTAGTTNGQRMQLTVVRVSIRTALDELGMPRDVFVRLAELNQSGPGLIIVSGLSGSGVTSTLYSLLRRHDAYTQQLVKIEPKAKVDLENVTQVEYKDQSDLPAKLASALRRDPDVVMVEECESKAAAELLCDAAKEKIILLGMTADSALVALARWVKIVGEARAAVTPLKAITCQALLRRLCVNCKEAYHPPKDMLAKMNLPAEKIDRFYRPPTKPIVDQKGNPVVCPTCRDTRYHDRVGTFELLEMTDEIRQLVLEGAGLKEIKAACRKNRMLYLQEQALRKVIEGVTSIDEVIRTVAKPR